MPNEHAGSEGTAQARAFEVVNQSLQNAGEYIENLRGAEEDSRAKLMFLEVEKKDAEIRSRLDADPEYGKKPTAEQQSIYEIERDTAIDAIRQGVNITHKKIVKSVEDGVDQYKARSSADYLERVVKPRVVAESRINDAKSDGIVIDTVTVQPTPENVDKAATNILARYSSAEAYAKYGAAGAVQLRAAAIAKLESAALTGFQESMASSPIASFSGQLISTENMKQGEVSLLIADQKLRFQNLVAKIPMTEQARAVLINKGEKYIDDYAKRSVNDHNAMVKERDKARLERVQDTVDTWAVQLGVVARNGKLSEKVAFSEFSKLIANPDIANDPQAVKKAYVAFDRVSDEIAQQRRHAERLASDARTRQSINQLRIDNGVAVSSEGADQVWKKNGTLKSFFDNGNVLSPSHLQFIDKTGAVPTSILGSIQSDLSSSDARVQQRGIQNLMQIKGTSSRAQLALYREMPDDFAGVINRLENGQTPKEALAFLTRPRNTPDVEKKLRNEARNDKVLKEVDGWMKDIPINGGDKLNPANMSNALKGQLQEQWEDAYARANGDKALARDLFTQDLSKNREIGYSKFSKKIEKRPLTNFVGSKEVATTLINNDLPETKGKDITPVFSGMLVVDGQSVPTYDIYVKNEAGLQTLVNPGRPFYTTRELVAKEADRLRDADMQKSIAASEELKENRRYWENKKPNPITRGHAQQPASK
ncbi:MAG: hypothetical protein V4757_06650 [Pseudomonadota bacterium]